MSQKRLLCEPAMYLQCHIYSVTWHFVCAHLCLLLPLISCRRLFNWFAFILFFYNGIAGLVGAILRALMASLFGLLLLFRLDRIVLMKGFEAYDFG